MNRRRDPSGSEAALDWAIRIQDPAFDDWEGHLAWLEADAAHPALHRRAALALADGLAALPATLSPAAAAAAAAAANDDDRGGVSSVWRGGWLVGATAVAASIAAVLIPRAAPPNRDAVFRTAIGETRDVTLADGTRLALNGGTSVRLPASNPRLAILEDGEVFVDVVHDATRPFRLVAQDAIFDDVGTRFDARTDRDEVQVAVAEGAVAYDRTRADIRVDAGRSIQVSRDQVVLSAAPLSAIGTWRLGRLVYADANVERVVTDLSRSLGERIKVSEQAARQRFSGVIDLHAPHSEIVARFAGLARLSLRCRHGYWYLDTRHGNLLSMGVQRLS